MHYVADDNLDKLIHKSTDNYKIGETNSNTFKDISESLVPLYLLCDVHFIEIPPLAKWTDAVLKEVKRSEILLQSI